MKVSANMRIMVVDDSQDSRLIMKNLLSKKGFKNISLYASAREAYTSMAQNWVFGVKTDLILCDYMMPRQNGLDFFNEIRKDSHYKCIPFIMITSVNDRSLVIECIEKGINNFILKPLSGETLFGKIAQTMKKINVA